MRNSGGFSFHPALHQIAGRQISNQRKPCRCCAYTPDGSKKELICQKSCKAQTMGPMKMPALHTFELIPCIRLSN